MQQQNIAQSVIPQLNPQYTLRSWIPAFREDDERCDRSVLINNHNQWLRDLNPGQRRIPKKTLARQLIWELCPITAGVIWPGALGASTIKESPT
jgi:hypothetical protein